MIQDNGVLHLQACPAQDELDAFNHGQLPPDKLESVAEHLSACERCASSLQDLQATDTVLMHLRYEPEQIPLLTEAHCQQLEDRACAIPLEQTATVTVLHGTSADLAEGPPLPAVFGAYLLLERLGQGGMGIVYKARQESLKRLVALKMVRAGVYASAEERMRFHREGEVIASLQHTHVVQIHEFGEYDSQLFFSMELLEGGTLAAKLNGRSRPEREAAELVHTLARAVQAAHQRGIVHRDLKPSNVLFAADGTARITDFGLAKVLDDESSDTRSDAILGTPSYMAPEQARGESRTIGPSADVYALGAILYEALTGQPPFRAETRFQTLEWVRTREPEAPSRRRPGLSRVLEAICLKCLEKRPGQRYESAAKLANELDNWLKGEPTEVRPLSRAGRVWRAVRRRPRLHAAVALLTVLLLTGSLAWYRLDPQRPIRNIERRLDGGEAVTLIGETGLPAWFHWHAGEGETQIASGPDGVCSLHSWALSLLELVRDPQQDYYRFRAEVRHDKSHPSGNVGLYFAHRSNRAGPHLVHYYGVLTFDDINDTRALHKRLPPLLNPPPPPAGNAVFLAPRLYSFGPNDQTWSGGVGGLQPALFHAAGLGGGPWHQLVVEVTPDGVHGLWDGKDVGTLTAHEWVDNTTTALKWWDKKIPEDPRLRSVQPEWLPRGSLGLYLYWGSASFRRVVVEPLRPSN